MTFIIISFSSGFDSAIIIVSAASVHYSLVFAFSLCQISDLYVRFEQLKNQKLYNL